MSSIFIETKGEHLIWMQYLIELGLRGTHPLFEPDEIRNAFKRDISELADIGPQTISEVNIAIKNILQASDIETQKNLIHDLEPNIRDIVVRLYFQMIDKNFIDTNPTKH
jgi:hypothetical protein